MRPDHAALWSGRAAKVLEALNVLNLLKVINQGKRGR